jgi:hypothetical protein
VTIHKITLPKKRRPSAWQLAIAILALSLIALLVTHL